MKCPACPEAMIVLESDLAEIDHCTGCKGVWLDSGELEILLGQASDQVSFLDSFRACEGHADHRKCPICGHQMEQIFCGTGNQVYLDRCLAGHGIWFDSGELEQILSMTSFGQFPKVTQWLKSVFKGRNQ